MEHFRTGSKCSTANKNLQKIHKEQKKNEITRKEVEKQKNTKFSAYFFVNKCCKKKVLLI